MPGRLAAQIFVCGFGVATLLSNLISLGYFLLSLVKTAKKSCLAYTFPEGLPSKEKIRSVLSVGFPSALTNLLFDTSNLFLNHLMAGFGDAPLAALGIVMKAERIPLNTGLGNFITICSIILIYLVI